MRRVGLLVLLVPLLVACGSSKPQAASTTPAPHLDVANHALVAFKKQTHVPDCPQVASQGVGGGMPSVTLPCLGGGRPVDVAGLRGPMIVNFWASWCVDCRQEMPALASYARSQSAVKVVGIDYVDQQPGAALALAQMAHVAYPLLADPDATLDHASPLPHIPGLPLTAFLDASGRIVHLEAGAMTTEQDVAAAARKYLRVAG